MRMYVWSTLGNRLLIAAACLPHKYAQAPMRGFSCNTLTKGWPVCTAGWWDTHSPHPMHHQHNTNSHDALTHHALSQHGVAHAAHMDGCVCMMVHSQACAPEPLQQAPLVLTLAA